MKDIEAPPAQGLSSERRRYRVTGKVQRVFFRASTQQEAVRLGLSGSATNLPDGSVEVIACGPTARLDELAAWLWRGPSTARVSDVQLLERSESLESPAGFVTA